MRELLISRRVHPNPSETEVRHIPHKYPFKTLGRLWSHVYPHFVIYNVGKELAAGGKIPPLDVVDNVEQCMGISSADAYRCLLRIQKIYRSWTSRPAASPPKSTSTHTSPSYPGDEDNDGDNSEDRNRDDVGGPIEGTSDALISTIGKSGRKSGNVDEGENLSTHRSISFPCTPNLDMNDTYAVLSFL